MNNPSRQMRQQIKLDTPILAALLGERKMSVAITLALGAHGAALALGWPGFDCPLRAATGVPCPGCGLSRAGQAMLQGQWATMAQYHLFAPFFAIAFILIAVSLTLPARLHGQFVGAVARFERQTRLVAITLILLVMYWLVRLLWLRESFVNLIVSS
ncbi:MAG: DUF2752 domain-containing protein [Anaerolineae bacterium]|nr:DUF2752 domain-containing protein [Anaerolineae bacterium]